MVKVNKLVAAIATTFTLSATGAYALNLGEISWKSSYGQPLSARIELSDYKELSATSIKVSLATKAEFSEAGIDYSNELSKLIFTTIITKKGKAFIQVTSNSPIKEPYLDFLLNLSYQGNKLSKDYTILLDLPSQNSKSNDSTKATNKADKLKTTTSTGSADSYRTLQGDTLWSVAEKLYNTNNVAKAATSIYKKNPKAFINGSANHLLAGYTLKLPTDQEIRAISIADANTFIQSTKSVAPNKLDTKVTTNKVDTKQTTQLENKLKVSEQQLNKARIENDKLSIKLDQLQTEITKLDEVSKLKDQQIQSIKSKIAEQMVAAKSGSNAKSQPADEPQPKPTTESKPVDEPQPKPTTESKPVDEPQPKSTTESKPVDKTQPKPTTESKPVDKPQPKPTTESKPVDKPQPKPKPTTKAQPINEPVDDTLFLGLDASTLIKIGGGVLLVICIAGLILRRKKAAENETEIDLSHIMLNASEEQNSDQKENDQASDMNSDSDNPLAGLEGGSNTIDKADIYLAYNRYTEARDLLLEALKTDPTNTDYHAKLLEIYAEQGDKANFESEAQELLLLNPLAQQKVDALRANHFSLTNTTKNTLFPEEYTSPVITAPDVSSVSEHDKFTNDINEPIIIQETSTPTDTTVFDLDTNLEQTDPFEKTNTSFELDTIHEEPVAENPIFSIAESDSDDFNADSPVYEFGHEEPQIKEAPKEEDFKFDLGIGQEIPKQEKLPEEKIASDSFTDSFAQSLETTPSSVEEQSTKDVAEHADEIIEKDQVTTKLELVNAYIDMSDTEGALDLLNEILQEGNDVQKAEAQKLLASIDKSATIKVEEPLVIPTVTESIDQQAESIATSHVIDMSSTPSQDHSESLDISPSANELDLGFELSQDDEVSTKIELARAYIDMGDMSGAREILDEVLKEGNADQKKQAEQLISTLS